MTNKTLIRPEEIKRVIPLPDGRELTLSRPLVMGVLNVTPDSFSDGGRYRSIETAVEHALRMEADGADIIDVGGESTRPGAEQVASAEEQARVIPVIERIRQQTTLPVSIDTYHADTAQAAVEAGADIINDISALRSDPNMVRLLADKRVPVVLMHMLGEPRSMQENPHYDNCVEEIAAFFSERIKFCVSNGIDKSRLILDPGIGFGKRLSDNVEILAGLRRYTEFNLPILIGASRKSFIGMLHPTDKQADQRLGGSIAAAVVAALHGASILRAHDVARTVEALKVMQAVREAR
jgi:dihydropteroate synthase